jgi:hypothetical protein
MLQGRAPDHIGNPMQKKGITDVIKGLYFSKWKDGTFITSMKVSNTFDYIILL